MPGYEEPRRGSSSLQHQSQLSQADDRGRPLANTSPHGSMQQSSAAAGSGRCHGREPGTPALPLPLLQTVSSGGAPSQALMLQALLDGWHAGRMISVPPDIGNPSSAWLAQANALAALLRTATAAATISSRESAAGRLAAPLLSPLHAPQPPPSPPACPFPLVTRVQA